MNSIATNGQELKNVLFSFRREFLWVGFFSLIANLLMLSPTLYMLQIYDRVLASQSELTLLFLTLIIKKLCQINQKNKARKWQLI
jgi:ATP-binding cassette subfamily C exporter for protease/lipase